LPETVTFKDSLETFPSENRSLNHPDGPIGSVGATEGLFGQLTKNEEEYHHIE
jgi:hypothetical protein